jgi:hypothetical protein
MSKPEKMSLQCLIVSVAIVALVFGCATTGGTKPADKVGDSFGDLRDEIVNLKQAVNQSMAALDQTVEQADKDPRKPYKDFSKSVDKVGKSREKVGKRAEDVKTVGAAYFKEWEKQLAEMNNPDIRAKAEERKEKLNEIFGNFGPLVEQTNSDFDAFYADLKDLRAFLGQDLTVAGIEAAQDIINTTRESGTKVDQSFDELIEEMNTIEAAITPSKAPPK